VEKEKLTWRSFVNGEEIVAKWNLPGTPTFYVIDHHGVIRHKWVGSPSGYDLSGMPDAKAIASALEQLIRQAEKDARRKPR
jgi:hypothetical protein